MSEHRPELDLRSTSAYSSVKELAAHLRKRLESGEFAKGTQLPSVRALMHQTGLPYSAVNRAMGMLAEEGWVEQRRGAGTFVLDRADTEWNRGVRYRRIGVVPPNWGPSPTHSVVGGILQGICEHAEKREHRVEIIPLVEGSSSSYAFADTLLSRELDGVIWIQPKHGGPASLIRLLQAKMPVIVTGRPFKVLPVKTVHSDMPAFGELVADYLEKNGRTNPIVLAGRRDDGYGKLYIDAFRDALERRGGSLPDERIVSAFVGRVEKAFYSIEWKEIVTAFLRNNMAFDAVLSLHEEALEPLVALHASGEKKCPEDYLLIQLAQSARPAREHWSQLPITLVNPPLEAMGRQAVKELEALWGITDETDTAHEDLSPWLDMP